MHCIVFERPALLHHDPEELYDTWCNATKTERYADIIPFKSIIIKAKISELCEYTPQNFWPLLHTHSVHIYHQCHNTGASSYAEWPSTRNRLLKFLAQHFRKNRHYFTTFYIQKIQCFLGFALWTCARYITGPCKKLCIILHQICWSTNIRCGVGNTDYWTNLLR